MQKFKKSATSEQLVYKETEKELRNYKVHAHIVVVVVVVVFKPLFLLFSFQHLDGGSTTKALRLKTNNSTNSGLVEIYHGGSWEPICYDGWDIHDAFVACRQLGFPGAKSITRETAVGVTRSLKKVQCQGGEDTLGECVHNGWSQGNCNYGFAGVICSGKLLENNLFVRV